MRHFLPALLMPLSLGACATGYASDWFRDEANIIGPQLLRYGFAEQRQCVAERLGGALSRQELRRLQERAALIRPNGEVALTPTNFRAIAGGGGDRRTAAALDAAITACNVADLPATTVASVETPQPTDSRPATPAASGQAPLTSGGIPVDMTPLTPPAATTPAGGRTWLNLGAAESGQSIAIDAMSIEQAGAARTAWFRMTDPDTGSRTNNLYRLRIDCQARTVQPLALRQTDETGAQISAREYSPAEAVPGAAEAGTVLEIAYISLCT